MKILLTSDVHLNQIIIIAAFEIVKIVQIIKSMHCVL